MGREMRCPNCGSLRVTMNNSWDMRWACNHCGRQGDGEEFDTETQDVMRLYDGMIALGETHEVACEIVDAGYMTFEEWRRSITEGANDGMAEERS